MPFGFVFRRSLSMLQSAKNSAQTSMHVGSSPTITRVETVLVDVPLGQRTITDSQSSVDSVEFVQVRIDTDAGVTGYGFNWNYSKGLKAAKVMIDECYASAVIGKPALERHSLMKAMHSTTHFIGRVGVARVGLAAMNLALWDIQLKLEDQPLWRHLGRAVISG
jgi:L-alanine-DL-glutamate epimerase-like enolase superfamily enzyme